MADVLSMHYTTGHLASYTKAATESNFLKSKICFKVDLSQVVRVPNDGLFSEVCTIHADIVNLIIEVLSSRYDVFICSMTESMSVSKSSQNTPNMNILKSS